MFQVARIKNVSQGKMSRLNIQIDKTKMDLIVKFIFYFFILFFIDRNPFFFVKSIISNYKLFKIIFNKNRKKNKN